MTTTTLNLDLLKVAEVADALRVSEMTVYRLIESGELPAFRIGGFRIQRADLDAFIAERRINKGRK